MKRYIVLLTFFILLVCAFPSNIIFAESSATISVNSSNITTGDKFSITISFTSSSDPIESVDANLLYDENIIKYMGSNGGSGSISIKEISSDNSKLSLTVTLSFEALRSSANTVLSLTGEVFGAGGTSIEPVSTSKSFEVKGTVTLSSNANLKDIKIPSGNLTPSFSASVTNYTVTVENSISDFPLQVIAADSKATIAISSPSTLQVGKNTRTITVTAEDGTKKIYTITVTRKEASTTSSKTTSTPTKTSDTPTKAQTQTPSPSNTKSPTEAQASQPTQNPPSTEPVITQSILPTASSSTDDAWVKFKNTVIWVIVLSSIIIISVIFLTVYLIKRKESRKNFRAPSKNKNKQRGPQQNRGPQNRRK